MRLFLTLVACALLTTGGLWAQTQPADATNAQDEQVNIVISPPADGDISSLSILRTDDFTDQNDYVSRMYRLETQGMELQPHLRLLVEQEGGRVRPWLYIVPETGEHENWIQVVCPPYQIPYVEEIIETMSRPGTASIPGGTRLHLRMRNQLASSVADIIGRTEVTGDGFAQADDITNTLFIFDSESDAARDLAAAQYYDVPARMVGLGVQIIEVDVTDSETIGLDWDAWKTSASGFLSMSSASRSGLPGQFFSFDTMLNIDATAVAEFLNYLVHTGKATVITNANLTVVNGQPATLSSARHIPYIDYVPRNWGDPTLVVDEVGDVEAGQGADVNSVVFTPGGGFRADLDDVSTADEGYSLIFTPIIGTDSMVCNVSVDISSIAGHNDLDEPILSNYHTDTMIGLVDGGTCLLGAFDRRSTLEVQDGLPLLRRIPVLGESLFSETTEEVRQTKLIVLVTPRIDENLTYTADALLNGRRVPAPVYDPYTSPPCTEAPAEFSDAAQDAIDAVDAAEAANAAEWR
jgi:type II secretory pathway component GspD/PulD (secretin)